MTTVSQPSFVSGELSPRLFGRTDLAKYFTGLASQENFITQVHGGSIRRSGSRFVAETKDSARSAQQDRIARLIDFQFNVEQTYMLEFGHLYLRFYRNGARLEQAPGTPTEIVSPYEAQHLRDLKFVQSADILTLTHPEFEPRELRRIAGDDSLPGTWTLAQFDSQDGPYLDPNTDSTKTLTPSALSGNGITVTATGHTPFSPDDVATPTNKGRLIRISHLAAAPGIGSGFQERTGWAEIKTFTSSSVVLVDIKAVFFGTTATDVWRLGAWADSVGWPWTVTIHQEREWFGGSDSNPQRLYGSVLGLFNVFSPTTTLGVVDDTHAITRNVSADQVNAIRWLLSEALGLAVLTEGGEWIASSGQTFDPITPLDFTLRRQSRYGSHSTVQPHLVGNVILFLDNTGREIREFVFDFGTDRFDARDLTILAEHMTFGSILDSAYQRRPNSVLWLVRCDGTLVGMTYERKEEVIAWHRQIIGGSLSGASRPKVESIAVVREDRKDQLWMVVKRTINGKTRRYIEFIEPEFDNGA